MKLTLWLLAREACLLVERRAARASAFCWRRLVKARKAEHSKAALYRVTREVREDTR